MEKTYVFEGKTTNEAIENGLKELKVSKNKVDIKVLETEEKRSFFNILTPRVVKVEMTLKENIKEEALEQGNMSREETREFIEDKLNKSGLELTEAEKEYATEEIEEKILDESRFPRREF